MVNAELSGSNINPRVRDSSDAILITGRSPVRARCDVAQDRRCSVMLLTCIQRAHAASRGG
jgi:hypothetical protein